jgi:hypothetical protein
MINIVGKKIKEFGRTFQEHISSLDNLFQLGKLDENSK